ncbi:MAG: hypothetical protein QM658_10705 [Gordonia sp. (in: high G+C Gram-positive bacteria)]
MTVYRVRKDRGRWIIDRHFPAPDIGWAPVVMHHRTWASAIAHAQHLARHHHAQTLRRQHGHD